MTVKLADGAVAVIADIKTLRSLRSKGVLRAGSPWQTPARKGDPQTFEGPSTPRRQL